MFLPKKKLFYAAFLLLNLILLAAIGEICARIYLAAKIEEASPASHPSRCLNEENDENAPIFKPGCSIPGLFINSLGFRSRETTTKELQSRKRIMILGESVAFGWGTSSNEAPFGYLLEERLGVDRYAVLNAGIPGRTMLQTIRFKSPVNH